MKLTGSRASGDHDPFSDWDYQVESVEDFEEIKRRLEEAVIWKYYQREPVHILTLIDPLGTLWDFNGIGDDLSDSWQAIASLETDPDLNDYWIISFKHLKGLHRRTYVLADVGIEMSTGLARDIYLKQKYGIEHYKDFFSFKKVAATLEADTELSRVTGMAYATRDQKISKIIALNEMIVGVTGDKSKLANQLFSKKLGEL